MKATGNIYVLSVPIPLVLHLLGIPCTHTELQPLLWGLFPRLALGAVRWARGLGGQGELSPPLSHAQQLPQHPTPSSELCCWPRYLLRSKSSLAHAKPPAAFCSVCLPQELLHVTNTGQKQALTWFSLWNTWQTFTVTPSMTAPRKHMHGGCSQHPWWFFLPPGEHKQ